MIDSAAIFAHDFGQPVERYTTRDAMVYTLGLGLGADLLNAADLRFLDERDLAVLQTFAVTLFSPGTWIREPQFGLHFAHLVHSAQTAEFFAPLPPSGEVRGTARVLSLSDRGEGRGAIIVLERKIADAANGTTYCSLAQTVLLRGDGGFDGVPPETADVAARAAKGMSE